MSYGFEAYNGAFKMSTGAPLGALYVDTLVVASTVVSTSYSFPQIPYDKCFVVSTGNGSHDWSISNDGSGGTVISVSRVSSPILKNSVLYVFSSFIPEPSYGINAVTATGERLISCSLPTPRFLMKLRLSDYTPSIEGTWSQTLQTWTISMAYPAPQAGFYYAIGTSIPNGLVKWMPNMSVTWAGGNLFITVQADPGTGGMTGSIPEVFLFEMGPYVSTPSSDVYGARVYSGSGSLLYDSGYSYLLPRMKTQAYDVSLTMSVDIDISTVGGTPVVMIPYAEARRRGSSYKEGGETLYRTLVNKLGFFRPSANTLRLDMANSYQTKDISPPGAGVTLQTGQWTGARGLILRAEDYGGATI